MELLLSSHAACSDPHSWDVTVRSWNNLSSLTSISALFCLQEVSSFTGAELQEKLSRSLFYFLAPAGRERALYVMCWLQLRFLHCCSSLQQNHMTRERERGNETKRERHKERKYFFLCFCLRTRPTEDQQEETNPTSLQTVSCFSVSGHEITVFTVFEAKMG